MVKLKPDRKRKAKRLFNGMLAGLIALSIIPQSSNIKAESISITATPSSPIHVVKDRDGNSYEFPNFKSRYGYTSFSSPLSFDTLPNPKTKDPYPAYCIEIGQKNAVLTNSATAHEDSTYGELSKKRREVVDKGLFYGLRRTANGNGWVFLNQNLSSTGYTYQEAYIATQAIIWEGAEGMRTMDGFDSSYDYAGQKNTYFRDVLSKRKSKVIEAYNNIVDKLKNHDKRPSKTYEKEIDAKKKSLLFNDNFKKVSGNLYRYTYKDSTNRLEKFDEVVIKVWDGTTTYKNGKIIKNTSKVIKDIKKGATTLQIDLEADLSKITKEKFKLELEIVKNPFYASDDSVEEIINKIGGMYHWINRSKDSKQERLTGVQDDPLYAYQFFSFVPTPDIPDVPNDVPTPVPTFPDFTLEGLKHDLEVGFDGATNSPRGDGTLAAGFDIDVATDLGKNIDEYMQANHNGEDAKTMFKIWENISEVNITTATVTSGEIYRVTYTGTAEIVVTEVVPEGYLLETDSKTGDGIARYTVNYRATASRPISTDPVTGTISIAGDWGEMQYTINGTNYTEAEMPTLEYFIGLTQYTNLVKKGKLQIVKGYDKDLDPFSKPDGIKEYMENSLWTIQLLNGGSENHPYIRVVPIQKGEQGYDDYANNYRVVNDTSGVAADNANPLVTNKFGQIRVHDIPYGTYLATEIKAGTEGYVLERFVFTVTDDGQLLSQDVIDYVIKNEVEVVKVNSETGKTVAAKDTAFRIRYMGNPNTANVGGDVTQDPNYGRYLVNGNNLNDGYQYVFYTDTNGKIVLPYELPYGNYQLEEIVVPEGYYIGQYGEDGKGELVNGNLGFYNTVVIYDKDGNKVKYTENENVIYNFYPFQVLEQNKGETKRIEIEMKNNAVKGKIEISKVGEKLVGFKNVITSFGATKQPIYEMKPLEGATFDILSAEDVYLPDGVDAPPLYDLQKNLVNFKLLEFNHNQFPNAIRLEEAKLPDGSESYYVTQADNNKKNYSYATLLTAIKKGTTWEVVYEQKEGSFTNYYTVSFGLEYSAGGWNYSALDVMKETVADDYTGFFPNSEMPTIKNGNDVIVLETQEFSNKNKVEFDEVINRQNEVSEFEVRQVAPRAYYAIVAEPTESNKPIAPNGETIEVNAEGYYTIENGKKVATADYDGNFYQWLSIENHEGGGVFTNRPIEHLPEGWQFNDSNVQYFYMIENLKTGEYMVWVDDFVNGTQRFINCEADGDFYKTRTQKVKGTLVQHVDSKEGFSVEFDGLVFNNVADGKKADVNIVNPTDKEPTIVEGVGVTTETKGKTTTMVVPMPKANNYFQMEDGVQTSVTYLGGFTKTEILVPADAEMPVITYKGKAVDCTKEGNKPELNPSNEAVETILDPVGVYVKTKLIMATQSNPRESRLIEIVDNATTRENAVQVQYNSSHEGYSLVTTDTETGALRGQLVISAETKTLKSSLGTVVDTITTGADGKAVSTELPLGKYYVREKAVESGHVSTDTSYEVNLEYEGQYVPLVWRGIEAQNNAVNVELDIYKEFQKVYGQNAYEPKAGATFGVFAFEDITTTETAATEVDTQTVKKDEMLLSVTTNNEGKVNESVRLPFGKYYVKEISTLPNYKLSNQKFVFVIDEGTYSGTLDFDYIVEGIHGKVSQSKRDTVDIEILTKYQLPSLSMKVNGEVFDTYKEQSIKFNGVEVENTITLDRSSTKIRATKPVTLEFENGGVVTINPSENTYTVEFEDGKTPVEIDKGTSTNIQVEEKDGKKVVTYNPFVAFTGYSMNVESKYVEPQALLKFESGMTAKFNFDKVSGAKQIIVQVPKEIEMPKYDSKPDYLQVDEAVKTLTIDTSKLAAENTSLTVGKETLEMIKKENTISISAKAKVNVKDGLQRDGLTVRTKDDITTIMQQNKVFELQSALGQSVVKISMNHDYSFAIFEVVAGNIVSAYQGITPIALDVPVIVNSTEIVTVKMADGTLYTITLEKGLLKAETNGYMNGQIEDANSPRVLLNGSEDNLVDGTEKVIKQTFPLKAKTLDEIEMLFNQSVTYARNDSFVEMIQVKINSKDDLLPDVIPNDKETPDTPTGGGETPTPLNPEIGTQARDSITGTHEGTVSNPTTIIDTVMYKNLTVGKEYTVNGVLMDKYTNQPLLVNGKEVAASKTFIAEKTDGEIEIEFTFDGSVLWGKEIVVFEKLYNNKKEVAAHEDITDEGQTIKYPKQPEIGTQAKDSVTGTHEGTVSNPTTIIDTVMYKNLIVGKEYTVNGVLMDKATKKPLLVSGKKVTASKTFIAEKTDGEIEIEFTFDGSTLYGKDVVVFEKLYNNKKEVAAHEDITDEGQTIKYPKNPKIPDEPVEPSKTPEVPKTGVQSMEWVFGLVIGLLLSVGLLEAIKRRRVKQCKEN